MRWGYCYQVMGGGHIQSGGQCQGLRMDGQCHTGGHCQGIREKGKLPGVQGRGEPIEMGTHPKCGTLCSIREEYRERRHSQTGDTAKRSGWVHIQSGRQCQGIRTGGTLSYGRILPEGQGWGTLLDWGTQLG